jgi:hypothetical protein
LMDTTRSFNSSTLGSIFASATQSLLVQAIIPSFSVMRRPSVASPGAPGADFQ